MSKFKVGDKVYMKHDPEEWGVITEICEDNYKHPYVVKNDVFTDMYAEHELLGTKEAFLERLQSLMREFDAEIQYFDGLAMRIGNSYEAWSSDAITADTIMDFDKE